MSDSDICWTAELGTRDYEETAELQRHLVEMRRRGLVPDLLLFVEHPATYTIGRAGRREHMLADAAALERIGARLVSTVRGGDVTFHGPGQIVGYPIFDLDGWKKDAHAYLRGLERTIVLGLAELGVASRTEPGLTGVWHDEGKLAAIGVHIRHWVASHGFAVNVSTDLAYFKHIVPCGIVGRDVSSVESVLRRPTELSAVREALRRSFGSVFSRRMSEVPEAEIMAAAGTQ